MGHARVTVMLRLTDSQHRQLFQSFVSQLPTGAILSVERVLDPEL
jgi:hypothetical protein